MYRTMLTPSPTARAFQNTYFCHQLYEALVPQIAAGTLQVHWIVTGLIKPSSQGKAYAILAAEDPLAALATNEKTFNSVTEEGGITPLNTPAASVQAALAANEAFMRKMQFPGTPVILYETSNGMPYIKEGVPSDDELKAIIHNSSHS